MRPLLVIVWIINAVLLAACGIKTGSTVSPPDGPQQGLAAAKSQKSPQDILVTEDDITDRPYVVLGDIEAYARKNNILERDPTKEDLAKELQSKAAAMGADAVVLVRYGTVGITMFSWGRLEGRGRAVAFTK